MLCSKCEAKLKTGIITHDDVGAATKLIRLAERNQEINKFTLVRGARVNGDFVLVLRASDVSALRANPDLANKIEKEIGQKVWFVETDASDRRFIENLFNPFKVLSVNFFWLPDSNKLTRVTIADDAKNGRVNIEKVQKIARAVRNMELLVEFNNK